MKVTTTFLALANLAGLALCQDATGAEPTAQDTSGATLTGQAALDYLFKYDPSRPHAGDDIVISGCNPKNMTVECMASNRTLGYDQGYLQRICRPRDFTGELGPPAQRVSAGQILADYRRRYSDSPFPCERLQWIGAECGASLGSISVGSERSIEEQNACLCDGDFWTALKACDACFHFHAGNETLEAKDQKMEADISNKMCTPVATAEATAYSDYSASYPGREVWPTSIVSDGAPGETAPVSYWPGAGSDLVAATIQEPEFVRTVDGAVVTMTPGVREAMTANETGTGTATSGASPTGSGAVNTSPVSSGGAATSSGAAPTETGAAMAVKPMSGLMAGVLGAVLLL